MIRGGSTSVTSQAINSALGFTPISANQLSVFAAGTAYTLTATPAAVVFGTTSPVLTITAPGTYLILARAHSLYNAATFAANRTLTTKLRRTNNTAADLTNGTVTGTTAIITTLTYSFMDQCWPVLYTTANSDDSITLFADISALPGSGSLQIVEASIIAIRVA